MVAIYHHIVIIIGDYVLLGGFKLGDKVLALFGLDEDFVECRSDEYFILCDRHVL